MARMTAANMANTPGEMNPQKTAQSTAATRKGIPIFKKKLSLLPCRARFAKHQQVSAILHIISSIDDQLLTTCQPAYSSPAAINARMNNALYTLNICIETSG